MIMLFTDMLFTSLTSFILMLFFFTFILLLMYVGICISVNSYSLTLVMEWGHAGIIVSVKDSPDFSPRTLACSLYKFTVDSCSEWSETKLCIASYYTQ